jgi:thiamine transport system permease protein
MYMLRRSFLALIPLCFLSLLFVYPLAAILRLSLSPPALAELFGDPYYRGVAWFSFWQALLSTILTLMVGLPAAFVFARFRFAGRSLLRALTTVPFVLPTVVTAAGFSALLGTGGLLGDLAGWLGLPPPQIIGTLGLILLAHIFYNVGVIVRLVGGLWAAIDPRLEQAAAMLGASRLRIFRIVTLPLLLPAIGAAALLVFIFTFGSFGVVLLLGGPRMATLEVEIYRQTTQRLNLEVAAGLALLQGIVTFVAGWMYLRLTTRQLGRSNLRARSETRHHPVGWAERLLLAGVVGVLLLLTLPLPTLAWRSLTLPATPHGSAALTFAYYWQLGENRRGALFFVPPAQAMLNSVGFGLAATLLALAVGIPAAYLVSRQPTLISRPQRIASAVLDLLFTLPLGISAVMLGLGYIVAWGPFGLLRSPLLIPAAHALLAFPLVVRTLVPALRGLNPTLREAARMLGASSRRVLLNIDLPLLTPALLAGSILAFTASLGEFGAALLLARPEYPTMPMVIGRLLGQPGASNYGQALALSTILMLISIAGFLLLERIRPAGVAEV